jgi:hypothetical protein
MIKAAGIAAWTKRPGFAVFLEKMNRQKKAPAEAGDETALAQRFPDSRNQRFHYSWHRTDLS